MGKHFAVTYMRGDGGGRGAIDLAVRITFETLEEAMAEYNREILNECTVRAFVDNLDTQETIQEYSSNRYTAFKQTIKEVAGDTFRTS